MSGEGIAGAEAPGSRRRVRPRAELAPAKINLTLEIRGRRPDGYHELESLVLFADFGDRLEYRAGGPFSLDIEGPFAAGLDGEGNLVERAALALWRSRGDEPAGRFRLVKSLPVAAGLGGGSADAAAVFRLLAAKGARGKLDALVPLAGQIGADVPCCLLSRAAIMTGIGERLHPLAPIEPVPAVLVNPMLPLATRDVFRVLSAEPLSKAPLTAPVLPKISSLADLLAYARGRGNDLEIPARRLLPVIGDVLTALAGARGALLARLSGSGPTCYALFATQAEATAAATAITDAHPGWWVQPVNLS
ncbi:MULTISPECIES: 4-(cytidine 5'-diphospho)-2-C-methyl-D-erythritol kinase [Rhodomicrobium]|uniref:4-(cytidine 5'-diphospho)-2-C-methyl-D-erythritol kinase n=1 Tax=Rhodomicrobium TaxID=1068 RepID=UPI0024781438|nr:MULTISPECIES: 4-(cytidine 5'-diphospho)-2-C-methyl-D-erythritol kinase [Rhodomicrobium]